ncbi:S-layer homology domain-containing protein [Lysinibacillus macroides]|uniref:S-layer protein n=1 Tax=Lysinibacillus macroides TaxID=33935 RepID=A0A0M9DNJ0_9BACI|nr:S-layer homology domain-containing protein [Lysinibacillus macroides]KOY83772.1 S-layer protein [Lysinibacillus macroides]QPR67036.1 S-layer homology domain-containing protein [Lysinibacillus macroides]
MDKTKIQKVNKAMIATVFATSGIAVVVPPPQKAAAATSPFKDIDQYSDHYNDILKLYSQGVIDGFLDNTFRPDVSVTRGQAAKMLATALKLDTKNVQDPYYKDVPKSSEFYRSVAALQNAGIMSGYSNSTFMPNEPITRGELAKIIVLAFHLEVSPTYNHIFKDVDSKSSNAIYIQTLIDLNITEGTTPVTFSPFEPVTRGQFASFVVGAQEKKSNETSFKITKVDEDAIYINGEAYRVSDSLAHIFNEDNAEVLKGALIEGNLSGKSLLSVSKLTLNASGTSSSFLEFDGDYGSLGASIVVNGNYIEFSNITLTGTVFVNETVRPSLRLGTTYNQPLTMGRVASLNTSFINWSNPDNEEEASSTNNPTNDLQNWTKPDAEQEKPFVNWTKEKQEMKNVEKHLIFYNSTVSRLVVSQSGTKIETNTKLPRVDINGSVQEFEIQGDIGTLNINTETKLTIYGEGNIDWINYKGNKDLELYIDGRVGTLYVENKYGKIDIGDYTYIDKVVIPKGETPNNIFDDFLEDKDNVGSITDPDGKPIDKDDIDNQQPDDKTKPTVSITDLQVLNGSEIEVKFNSNEVGTYYYIVREADADAPTRREMIDRLSNQNIAHGTAAAVNGTNTIRVSNLGEKKEYVIYILVVDGAKNASDIVSESFQMKDASPPVVRSLQVTPLHGGTRAEFTFTASEPGDYYYYVRPKTTAPDPTTEDIIANPTGSDKAVAGKLGVEGMLTGLEAETVYQLYVVMRDASGNLSVDPPVAREFTTSELDLVHPYVGLGQLERKNNNQFELTVSEALDPESANNIDNYLLTGTVIVNVTGERGIKPSAVKYEAGSRKVLLTIPSDTGFVNGDTLRVTVLPGVKDLADNAFENINTVQPGDPVRNYAEYKHADTVMPVITIENVINRADESDGFRRAEVEFSPNKAGTYYYMILPNVVIDNGVTKTLQQYLTDHEITARDFINEFNSTNRSNKFQINGNNIYVTSGTGTADLEATTQKFPVSVAQNALNPFNNYSVYMVLRDRGGELSRIAGPREVFNDVKAPLIRGLEIKPMANNDTKATISFETNETATVHYWFVEKKIQDEEGNWIDNPDANLSVPANEQRLEAELKGRPSVEKIGSGLSGTVEARGVTLKPHTDYVVYVGAEDTYGNFTIYQANSDYNDHNRTATGLMKQNFYSDGTPPRIGMKSPMDNKDYPGLIYRNNSDNTLTLTFNETIMRENAEGKSELISTGDTVNLDLAEVLTITDRLGADVTDQYEPVSYTVGTNTTEDSQLIIRPKTPIDINRTITVTMKDGTRDFMILPNYIGHNFINTGLYKYRTLDAGFVFIKFEPNTNNQQLNILFDLTSTTEQNYEPNETLKYYFVTESRLKDEAVIRDRKPLDVLNGIKDKTIEALATGTGTMQIGNARAQAKPRHSIQFVENDWITIVIEDKYGNLNKIYARVGYDSTTSTP